MSGYRINDCCSARNNCDSPRCSLPHRRRRISDSCLSQPAAWRTTTKRTEQNLTVCSGKSKAEVTNKPLTEDCIRRIVLLKITTDRHEASRGLSATAELLVLQNPSYCTGLLLYSIERVRKANNFSQSMYFVTVLNSNCLLAAHPYLAAGYRN